MVSGRYEHASLILTSNLPFSGWGQRLRLRPPRRRPHSEGHQLPATQPRIDTLPSIKTQDTAD
ncbi:hypothetical protein [Skermania piniformis]|uniref:hypothetical protein n=1 Tax=Skermania pinensis TaxID=39122 RepID=UPI002484D395|nr:hypothetical protein [Skermania piniformis]